MSLRSRDGLLTLLIFVVPAIAYLPVLHAGFLSDDYGFAALYSITWHDLVRCLQLVHSGDLIISPFRPVAMGSL